MHIKDDIWHTLSINCLSQNIDSIFYGLNPSEDQIKKYHKLRRLIQLHFDCLKEGWENLDWAKLHQAGYLCKNDYKVFDEIKGWDPYEFFPELRK